MKRVLLAVVALLVGCSHKPAPTHDNIGTPVTCTVVAECDAGTYCSGSSCVHVPGTLYSTQTITSAYCSQIGGLTPPTCQIPCPDAGHDAGHDAGIANCVTGCELGCATSCRLGTDAGHDAAGCFASCLSACTVSCTEAGTPAPSPRDSGACFASTCSYVAVWDPGPDSGTVNVYTVDAGSLPSACYQFRYSTPTQSGAGATCQSFAGGCFHGGH
jgi:hypothetical protein